MATRLPTRAASTIAPSCDRSGTEGLAAAMTAWSDGPDDLVAELEGWGEQGGPVSGRLVGRIALPAGACPRGIGGPTPVLIRDGVVLDLSTVAPTVSELLDLDDLVRVLDG